MWINYIKTALRNLSRNKTYALINFFGLAISICAVILIMLYVRFEFNYDDFHQNEIYRLSVKSFQENAESYNSPVFIPAIGPDLKNELPEIKNYTRISTKRTEYFYNKKDPVRVDDLIYADSTFFEIFSFKLISGNSQTALTAPYSIILTEETALKIFGETDVTGRSVNMNLKDNFIVTGIVENPPPNSTVQFNALISFETLYKEPNNYMGWFGGNQYITYLQLEENVTRETAQAKFPDFLWEKINKRLVDYNVRYEVYLTDLPSVYLSETSYTNIYIFTGIAILILLIASINFINLTTAHYTRRAKEVGIRKVIGADRKTLVIQFLSETIVISFISLLLGVALAALLAPYYENIIQKQVYLNILFDSYVLSGLFVLFFVVGVIAGSYPAFYLSSFQASKAFKPETVKNIGSFSLQNSLIIAQFTISISLIITTFVINDQLDFILNKELGYDKDKIIILSLENESSRIQTELIKETLLTVPGVQSASASTNLPGGGFSMNGYRLQEETTSRLINIVEIDDDYLKTLDIELISGRNYNDQFESDKSAYLVNKTFIETFGLTDPIGKIVHRNGEHKIIGVVEDFHFAPLHEKVKPLILGNNPHLGGFNFIALKVTTENYSDLLKRIEAEWKNLNPSWPFEYNFLDKKFEQVYKSEEKFMELFFYFASLAILIASLGLFSLTSLIAEQRTKEIGIRKVLGAGVFNLTTLLSRKFLILVLAANIIAWPVAYLFVQNWLEDFAYRISLDLKPFAAAAFIALLIAIVSVSYRTIKAALLNPLKSLKYE
ncbi:MAG: ABC transporter permease [Melioribacteraceae bacterium]|nr:ABC transporter permease [Melioribacteraceae bacterium]